ncbi:MAG: hypothetical protein K2K50_07160, partial [Anaeroplasmataceae bacterium]|nr:hypothetical protein [Anaeroplasmataceae bacterium]
MKKIISFICIILCSLALFSCKDKGFEEVELSDKMKEQIALDDIKLYEEDDEFEFDYDIMPYACQGKYKNIYFIRFLHIRWGVDVIVEFVTENYRIKIYGETPIRAYYNHKFYELEEIYNMGKVPESVLLALSEYTKEHSEFSN